MQPSIESDASKIGLVDERADAVLIQLTLEELAADGDVHAFATTGSIKIAAVSPGAVCYLECHHDVAQRVWQQNPERHSAAALTIRSGLTPALPPAPTRASSEPVGAPPDMDAPWQDTVGHDVENLRLGTRSQRISWICRRAQKIEWYGGFSIFFNRFHVLSNM
jgi:hypothetical protein